MIGRRTASDGWPTSCLTGTNVVPEVEVADTGNEDAVVVLDVWLCVSIWVEVTVTWRVDGDGAFVVAIDGVEMAVVLAR